MQGYAVRLREDGLFEAPSRVPGVSSIRIMHSAAAPGLPWAVSSLDGDGVRWTVMKSFSDLDSAMDHAVREAYGEGFLPSYVVVLPDGVDFCRPGRVPLERAMASAGWVFVNSLTSYVLVSTETDDDVDSARKLAMEAVEGTSAEVVGVILMEPDSDRRLWCADVVLPWEGFMRVADVTREAEAAFAMEGIRVIPAYGYSARMGFAVEAAAVIQFPEDRIARRRAA